MSATTTTARCQDHGSAAASWTEQRGEGCVYMVEHDPDCAEVLVNMSKRHPNTLPILKDAHHPETFGDQINEPVDVIIADLRVPDQADIMLLNAERFLKDGGGVVHLMDATIDTAEEVEKLLQARRFKPKEQLTLQPYFDGEVLVGVHRSQPTTQQIG